MKARFSPHGSFGLYFTARSFLLIIALVLFGVTAVQVVTDGPMTIVDVWLAQTLHSNATPKLTSAMLVLTHLHGITAVCIWTILFGGYLGRRREWAWLVTTTVGVGGVMLLNLALKYTFRRPRPSFQEPLVTLLTYSFPSGHTAATTVFYGVVATYLCSRIHRVTTRALVVVVAATLIGLVGLSRMYLGVHYFTDVIAASAEGCAWLILTLALSLKFRRRDQFHAIERLKSF